MHSLRKRTVTTLMAPVTHQNNMCTFQYGRMQTTA